ncbi:hypothetical protein SAMN05518683_1208 [Salibacterium halotolerans]|uniref:Uncharacterized protein n=1 Tax=Salibacterium halotolerans TaxID=1884432 RepID=A0A1I5WCP4_9BACI|nr:hypothetical protein SAMN05518683_1208 [Salibacterium halotolerans]
MQAEGFSWLIAAAGLQVSSALPQDVALLSRTSTAQGVYAFLVAVDGLSSYDKRA